MRVNHGLKPPDGPHFPVAPGVILRAHTFDMLYPMITEWRMRQGQAPCDPVADVNLYVCAKWPNACLQELGDGPKAEDLKRSMAQRVATWAAVLAREMPPGGYSLVDDGTAKTRAASCRICPYNRAWKTNCAPCNRTSEALLAGVRRLRSVNVDGSMLGCEVDGTDNDTACFLPKSAVDKSCGTPKNYWVGCWKLKP